MDFEFEIKRHIGVVSESKRGWTKELNMVSFAGKDAKFDIREWDPEHEKMGKGVTFTREELRNLYEILEDFFKDKAAVKRESAPGGGLSTLDIIKAAGGQ